MSESVDLVSFMQSGAAMPLTSVNLVRAAPTSSESDGEVEVLKLGPITMRVLEDGSRTDNRIGVVEIIIPPKTPGLPQHVHIMHDETFLVTSGRVRFTTGSTEIDTKVGDFVTVPPRAPHTFANPFDEPARMVNTVTPAQYIEYFRLLDRVTRENRKLTPEDMKQAMANYATLPFKPQQ